MRRQSFEKPVLYVISGPPFRTKSTIANKISDVVFETDGLEKCDRYNLNKFPVLTEKTLSIVVGGKYYKYMVCRLFILYMVYRKYRHTHTIIYIPVKLLTPKDIV